MGASLKTYKFKHTSFYKGVLREVGTVHELDDETANALGEDTVDEVKVKEVKGASNKQQKPEDTK